ncbi:unnamed protein product [Caenorhabditis bovis]|uniref:sphingomyelin phosphodiesterase n=1 Tax=Caenorhabditis bovis TaxID=2654633 RepID=A0A8S1F663_9PELO|nr:unnamed protein product [Caenorhabditis bovis]
MSTEIADKTEPTIRRESFSYLGRRAKLDPTQLRVVTLNAWCLPQPRPIGSADRVHRLERIGEAIMSEDYDIVGLQELWSYYDFVRLSEQVSKEYPYFHYFHSGFTGSGVCVFSRHRIISTLTHRYSLNGFAHHIHRGDWFGGKVVGLVEVEVGELRVNFYTTHLHAEYDRENDLYLPHRTSQSLELSQFVRHTSRGADAVIVTGDLNMEPCDLGFRLILSQAKLFDAWRMCHEPGNPDFEEPEQLVKCRGVGRGGTCDRPDNCYTKSAQKRDDESKRIDYILFKSGRANVKLEECEITLNQIPGEDINYSDHVGLCARFTIDDTIRQESATFEPNRPLLIEAIGIVSGGERRARHDRTFFLALAAFCLILILASLFIEGLPTLMSILRFCLTVVAVFFVWQGFIGLTLERKALKAAKQSMQQLLNN